MLSAVIHGWELMHTPTLADPYSQNPSAYLTLEDDKLLYFGQKVDGVIPYGVVGSTIVINGDPICADSDFPVLLAEFKELCQRSAHNLFFISVTDHFLEEYKKQGFGWVKNGEEARFHLADYEISGKKGAKMRMNINHARKAGVVVHEYCPLKQRDAQIEADLNRITNEWLQQKKSSMLTFVMGTVGLENPMDKRYFYATDADGKIVLPRRGAVITLALGWKGQPLFPKGAFTVDEIEHTGAPDRLTIRARSADFRETLNTRREKSWHKTTVGEVVKEIAARHKLKMALGKDLSDKPVEHIDQTNESDGSFLMRLARQYGAIASVKNGNLLFIRQGQGKSATGKPLPVITITRKDGDSHRFTLADRGAYTGVIASWLHTREPAKKESTTVKRKRRTKKQKKEPEAKQGDYLVGTDENVLVLNRTYANRGNAERAAKMQWERLQRGVASFSLQLAEGRADLYTEMPVKVSGFKQPIDDAEWTITTLTHTVSPDNGFTTSLELEVRIDDFEME